MGAGHRHHHAVAAGRAPVRRLAVVLAITLAVAVVQVAGSLVSGSLALLADAGHLLTDVGALGLALLAARLAGRAPSTARTFGWYRAEVLAAAVNALALLGVGAYVLVEAARRLARPPDVAAGQMLVVATVGLVAAGVCLLLLRPQRDSTLNLRGAYLEVLADLLGSVAVVTAALVVAATGWTRADPVASLLIGVVMVPRAWALLREAVEVLLEAAPRHLDVAAVRQHILDVPGVVDVHDLHVWVISSGLPVISAHVVVADEPPPPGGPGRVLDALGGCLADHFDIAHSTFQLEPAGHRAHERVPCP